MANLLRAHDIGALFRFLRTRGWSRNAISRATGLSENRVRQIATGVQQVREYHVFERIAEGLGIERPMLGLSFDTATPHPVASAGVRSLGADADAIGGARELAHHWEEVLQIVTTWSNDRGVLSITDLVNRQIAMIDHQRRQLSAGSALVLAVQARWSEFSSWTNDNAGTHGEAIVRASHALSQASEANDDRLVGYILMRQAQQAAERGEGTNAVTLTERAARKSSGRYRTLALCAVREAHGHSLEREHLLAKRCIDDAFDYVGRASESDSDQLDAHCTPAYVRAYEAYCRMLLGDLSAAVEMLQGVLATWPADMRQDEVMWRTWLARAYLMNGAPDLASLEGLRALELAHATGSARAKHELGRLAADLDVVGLTPTASAYLAAHRIIVAPVRRR